ncbi:MAG: metallophosphoesterase [Bryobacterales bacterium]|nr:metallophosphoesterase [Bryobacterales bacterium]
MYQHRGPLDRFAAIADVHGNRWALEEVLADIDRRGIHRIVNLGDNLFGPLDPNGAAALLMKLDLPGVAGNQDCDLLEPDAMQQITPEQRKWLAGLPPRLQIDDVLLFHGTPRSDTEYLLETISREGVLLADTRDIQDRLGTGALPTLLLCGHTHIPRVVSFRDRLIVNPGSVGLQAYSEDVPFPHVMETGSPHARYAVLERSKDGWNVEQIQLRYDWDEAALDASANGRQDWAFRVSTGRVR